MIGRPKYDGSKPADGMLLTQADGKMWKVFSPRWWELRRWWSYFFSKETGVIELSQQVTRRVKLRVVRHQVVLPNVPTDEAETVNH